MASADRCDPLSSAFFASPDASRIRGRRFLYVDDDSLLRQLVDRVLHDVGAICLPAATHDEAVQIAGAEPELAAGILDFQMPDGDVGQLVKQLRAARVGLPLIGTSGADRRHDFAERGVTRFLGKPWQPGDLVRALDG